MTDHPLWAIRARDALRVLMEAEGAPQKSEVWAAVIERTPLGGDEDASKAFEHFTWRTFEFVKAGWILKGGSDGWTITDAGREAHATITDPDEMIRRAKLAYTAWDKARKQERTSALATRIVPHDEDEEEIIRAAGVFVDRALVAGESVFSPGRVLWTEEVVSELERTFIAAKGTPGASFTEQLAIQLADASDDAKLLMAELVMVQLLPASTEAIGARRKAERVESVLGLMQHSVQIPAEISDAFASSAFHPGTRMLSNLGAAMTILVNFAAAWVRASADDHERMLDDPWAFRDFVRAVDGEPFPSQRWSLMFLVHSQSFVSIVSDDHKRRIRDEFIGEISAPTGDLDRDLLGITLALQVKSKGPINYYRSPLIEKWQPPVLTDDVIEEGDGEGEPTASAETGRRAAFPPADDALATRTYIDRDWLQGRLDLLERRRQVILYGPPGTGKTYVAKALARHITLGADPVIVQFHPSYAYEDFVEGYRPVVEDAGLVYRLKDGPFLTIARDARNNPETNYVLVIDEINRGNLAKVFGELYFLLEYRDESITLLYGDERFQLPSNVFLIGTMNTTDRSIALLDAAMRRRFAFVELHPAKEPTSLVLRRWLDDHGLGDEPARLLEALNSRIVDASAHIGPSYLMPDPAAFPDGLTDEVLAGLLDEIWRYELMPLLDEAHYGENRDLEADFGLASLRRALQGGDDPAG